MKKLSIIIPVYNEKKYLPLLLKKIEKVSIRGFKKEIVIVDDKSTDSTRNFLRKLKKYKKEVDSFLMFPLKAVLIRT